MLVQITTKRADTVKLHKVLTSILRSASKKDTYIATVQEVTERNTLGPILNWSINPGKKKSREEYEKDT